MTLKIFHTSDIHLGIKFEGYPEAVQEKLIEARFETLKRIVDMASEAKCDLLVVAGDLFHKVGVANKVVIRAAQILKEFQGKAVAVLPGNHDFLSQGKVDLWTQFKESAGDHVVLLEKQAVRSLKTMDLDVNLYPAPCDVKHSETNYIGWVHDAIKDPVVAYHIGIAHGSLEGFSPDPDRKYYPMTVAELSGAGVDLWLLGHTHLSYPVTPGARDRIFYPSTPEPDGFDCDHEGMAWIIEMDEEKKVKLVERVRTGTYHFMHDEAEVNNPGDIESIRGRYTGKNLDKILLKLTLRGRLSREDREKLVDLGVFLKDRLLYVQIDDAGVYELITAENINETFAEKSFPHTLLQKFLADKDQDALQLAYELLLEGKK
jgi:DNA repair exonuclease SbcCD nuclease subunit